jgi:diguanylate cyclase (GGDEF)-like protein
MVRGDVHTYQTGRSNRLRPQTLLAVIRAVTLATFALTGSAPPSRVLGGAALYVVGACVMGTLRPKWRALDKVLLIATLCADITWCTAAFVYYGPLQSLPAVLYAAAAAGVVAMMSGRTAIALGLSAAAAYGSTVTFVHRGAMLPVAASQVVAFQAVFIALVGLVSGMLAEQWRRLRRARLHVEQLRRLNQATQQAAVEEGEDAAVLQAATDSALDILEADRAWAMNANQDHTALVLAAHAGFAAPDRQDCVSRGEVGVAQEVYRTGESAWLPPSRHRRERLSELESALDLGQLMAAPIPGPEELAGVLVVSRDAEADPFEDEDLAVLTLLGQTVAKSLRTAQLIRDLHLSSTTDSLTGLHNHGVFLAKLAEHVQRAREAGEELSLVVLDMDGFKQINDTAGHWEGNRVLRALADALREACRGRDVVARCGGDEFAVLLPGVGPEEATLVAERAAHALQNAALRPGLRVPITASWGIASYPWDASTDEALFRRADDRLYEAKQAGGNHLAFDPIVLGAGSAGSCVRQVGARPPAPETTPLPF